MTTASGLLPTPVSRTRYLLVAAVSAVAQMLMLIPGYSEDGFELACAYAARHESFAGPATDLGAITASMHTALVEAYGEEPTDQEYGERRYTAYDPEGHCWYFATQIKQVAPEEWGATVA